MILRPDLRRLIPSLVAASTTLVACGSSDGTTMASQVACPSSDSNRYQSLTLAPDVDGIEFRSVRSSTTFEVLSTVGQTCKRASDQAACRAKVTATVTESGWRLFSGQIQPPDEYGVATRGDEVFLVKDVAALGKAVAPIDTIEEGVAFVKLAVNMNVLCSAPNATPDGDGFLVKSISGSCGSKAETLQRVARDGTVTQVSSTVLETASGACVEGRRPRGLVESGSNWLGSLCAHFTEIAHMEAAAVLAFDELIEHLRGFGAPADLLERAGKAREDEVRHAAATRALALRHGGRPVEPAIGEAAEAPSLLSFAIENMREGCVRETYGALVIAHQAAHAECPRIRAAFTRIRDEELEHAELSWDIASWLDEGLTPAGRAEVERARHEEIAVLLAAADVEPSDEVVRLAGMPTAATHRGLVAGLAPALALAA